MSSWNRVQTTTANLWSEQCRKSSDGRDKKVAPVKRSPMTEARWSVQLKYQLRIQNLSKGEDSPWQSDGEKALFVCLVTRDRITEVSVRRKNRQYRNTDTIFLIQVSCRRGISQVSWTMLTFPVSQKTWIPHGKIKMVVNLLRKLSMSILWNTWGNQWKNYWGITPAEWYSHYI